MFLRTNVRFADRDRYPGLSHEGLINHRSVIKNHGWDRNYNFLDDDEWDAIGQLHTRRR